ncbi:porin family protein [Ruegeria sp. Ofav3-42]|uniref:porin family protein n=1 Tax=Ruegeria sp. Ofav3-42 TaxID=2917759 RepID=UPI001EF5B5F1|nr:porin family protein [Ruegeria sp. Ofav3-42]MCG7522084.1 porin family protein [Ruegeria sp. Ofav3-42]
MKSLALNCGSAALALGFMSVPTLAQQRPGWVYQIDGQVAYQGDANLSEGGDFSASRAFLRTTALYNFDGGASAGLSASIGRFDYNFSQADNQPWQDIRDIRISVPVRFRLGNTASVFVSPQIRWDYQSGAEASDGRTYGVFAGIAWKINEGLTIGPAFGAFSQLEDDDVDFFPALLVDWDINDRWNLNTGSGIGATQGPGLTLSYALNDTMNVALSARSERIRFRLDGDGLAPNGVGEDKSIPVVLSFGYNLNPGVSLNLFAGAELDGRLTLDDANGTELSRQSYETAPLVGVAFRAQF